MVGAFKSADGGWTLDNMTGIVQQAHLRHAFKQSIEISLGDGTRRRAVRAPDRLRGDPRRDAGLDPLGFATFSGVAANFGGIPLAFAFIATLGTLGIVTQLLTNLGYNLYQHGFTLFTAAASRSSTSTSRSR